MLQKMKFKEKFTFLGIGIANCINQYNLMYEKSCSKYYKK
jgi:hypothetical protein